MLRDRRSYLQENVTGKLSDVICFVCLAVVGGVELTVKPFDREFYKPLGGAMVFTCQLELSEEEQQNDGVDVEYTIKWFDENINQEIVDKTGRLVFLLADIFIAAFNAS